MIKTTFKTYSVYVLVLCLLLCCKKSEYEDNFSYYNLKKMGWKSKNHRIKIDNLTFIATEVPILYYISQTYGEDNLTTIDSVYKQLKSERIIEFIVENKEQHNDIFDGSYTNRLEYTDAVEYFSASIKQDFFIVTQKKDTIPCNGVLFERTFKLTPYKKILLYFSNINSDEEIELIYKDHLFNKGEIKYKFNNHLIKL